MKVYTFINIERRKCLSLSLTKYIKRGLNLPPQSSKKQNRRASKQVDLFILFMVHVIVMRAIEGQPQCSLRLQKEGYSQYEAQKI